MPQAIYVACACRIRPVKLVEAHSDRVIVAALDQSNIMSQFTF